MEVAADESGTPLTIDKAQNRFQTKADTSSECFLILATQLEKLAW